MLALNFNYFILVVWMPNFHDAWAVAKQYRQFHTSHGLLTKIYSREFTTYRHTLAYQQYRTDLLVLPGCEINQSLWVESPGRLRTFSQAKCCQAGKERGYKRCVKFSRGYWRLYPYIWIIMIWILSKNDDEEGIWEIPKTTSRKQSAFPQRTDNGGMEHRDRENFNYIPLNLSELFFLRVSIWSPRGFVVSDSRFLSPYELHHSRCSVGGDRHPPHWNDNRSKSTHCYLKGENHFIGQGWYQGPDPF